MLKPGTEGRQRDPFGRPFSRNSNASNNRYGAIIRVVNHLRRAHHCWTSRQRRSVRTVALLFWLFLCT